MASKREALISSAEKWLLKGKVDSALKDYLKVLEETPGDINVLNKVGDLYVRLNRNDESIPFFSRIADHYAKDGFYVRAIAMYKKINKLDPARLEIYEKLAELYAKQQLWMEAKSNYQVLADYLLKQDNVPGAIGIYQKMAAIDAGNLQLHVKLADLFTQSKRIPEALKEYVVVAQALVERGATEEAIRVYEKALRLSPDSIDVLKALVPLLVSVNHVDEARTVLRKALETTPRSVPLFLLSADVALSANDMAEAKSFAAKAQAVEPDNEEVLSAVVRIQLRGRNPLAAFQAALPLVELAVRRGEAKKAITLLGPIAKAAPDNLEIVRKVGDVAEAAGDIATAVPYRSALSELYRKQGKIAEAIEALRSCARAEPQNAEFRARLAQLEPLVAGPTPGARTVVPETAYEITIPGFTPVEPSAPPAQAPPQAPAGEISAPAPSSPAGSFEFDLAEEDLVGEPSPATARTPARGVPQLPAADVWTREGRGAAAARSASRPPETPRPPEDFDIGWQPLSAAEAIEEFEARAKRGGTPTPPSGLPAPERLPSAEEIEEPPSVEFSFGDPQSAGLAPGPPPSQPSLPQPGGPASLSFELGEGWPAPSAFVAPPPEPSPAPLEASEGWDVPDLAVEVPVLAAPVAPRPSASESALDEALVEAEVFRKYGLLEKAVDQLTPFLEQAPESLRLREKLFEIYLEQGRKDLARAEADVLVHRYRQEGREERIRGLEALLGLPTEAPSHPVAAPPGPPPSGELSVSAEEVTTVLDGFVSGEWGPAPTVRSGFFPAQPAAPAPEVPLEEASVAEVAAAPAEPVVAAVPGPQGPLSAEGPRAEEPAREMEPSGVTGGELRQAKAPAPEVPHVTEPEAISALEVPASLWPGEAKGPGAEEPELEGPAAATPPGFGELEPVPELEVAAAQPLEEPPAAVPGEVSAAPAPAEATVPEVPSPESLLEAPQPHGTPQAEEELAELVAGLQAAPEPSRAGGRKAARPLPSADELLEGVVHAPPEARKGKAKQSRADELELDILGRKTPKAPRPKPAPAAASVTLPDDLLEGLARKAGRPARPAAPPTPAEPAAPSEPVPPQAAPPPVAAAEPEAPPEELPVEVAAEAPEAPEAPETPPAASETSEPVEATDAVETTETVEATESVETTETVETAGTFEAAEAPFEESADVPYAAPLSLAPPPPLVPTSDDLAEVDFCLEQGMVVDAAERLQTLESRFPGHPEIQARRQRLEGARGGEVPRPELHDILSVDLDSVLDAELGRALSDEMARDASGPVLVPPPGPAPAEAAPAVDDAELFSDEQDFFNFADELQSELKQEVPAAGGPPDLMGKEMSLEEIFRDFKKGVEQSLSPEDYETHYNLGIAYKEMGLTDEAIGEFQLAAKDPLHAVECCSMLGLCFLEKGLPQLAVKWYRKGLETIGVREEDKLGLQYDLAHVYEQIGDLEGAYRTYLEIYGTDAGYRDVPERLKELRPDA